MNLKTTFLLAILAAGGGLGWYYWQRQQPADTASTTAAFLEKELKADALTRIEVRHGSQGYVLERGSPQEEWTLPGKWPAREREVDALVGTLTNLHTRFGSFPFEDKKALFEKEPMVLHVRLGDKSHTLTLADEPAESNRFSRPTYLRLDEQPEVLRLAPGLVAALSRNEEYFRQRRLFPAERVAKDDSAEKVPQVVASTIEIARSKDSLGDPLPGGNQRVRLARTGDTWEMTRPVRDRVEPDKVKSLLTALPNLWAETFVERKGRSLEELGLDPPRLEIHITRPSGSSLDLLVGAVSRTDVRKEMKPGPPNQFGLPPEPRVELIKEEYRYAKLAKNDLIFEIKADKLDDKVPADPGKFRDPKLARFETRDARRLEVRHGGETIVLVHEGEKGKESWKLQQSAGTLPADAGQVTDLLTKLAGLEAQDKNIIDTGEPGKFGLDKPLAVIKVAVEESKGKGDDKTKTSRQFVFDVGASDKEKGKAYVRVEGWPRINAVDDALLGLVKKPAVAYRSRRLLDASASDVARIDIRRDNDVFSFEQTKGTWKLTAPTPATVESGKIGALAGKLANLEAVDFVSDQPKTEDLEKFGLVKPHVQATLHFTEAGKKTHTLVLGDKRKDAKEKDAKEPKEKEPKFKEKEKDKTAKEEEYYARLDQGPVFVVRKELHDDLGRDSLAYQPERPLDVRAEGIAEIDIRQGDQQVHLKRDGKSWKITSPFEAPAAGTMVDNLVEDLANLKAERYVAHFAKDAAMYGLDKPFLRVHLVPTAKDKDAREHTLLVGAKLKGGGRYARLENGQAIFVVGETATIALERKPMELLARDVLKLDPATIQAVRVRGTTTFTLQRQNDTWKVVDAPVPAFDAEKNKVQDVLQNFKDLQARKIAAYGSKVDLASFGLDKPGLTFTVVTKDKDDKTTEHTLSLGKEAESGRYARVDQGPAVFLLDEFLVRELPSNHLDFGNLTVLKLNPENVVGVVRHMPGGDVELAKKGEAWFMKERQADGPTVQEILREVGNLKATRIAAYPAKDLETFGLDKPAAVITLKVEEDGKPSQHVIKLGKASPPRGTEKGEPTGHFALVDKGDSVVILPAEVSRRLLSAAVNFTDHNLVNLFGADQAELERGPRKAIFAKVDGVWKMTEPIAADAEETSLFDFIRRLQRLRADEIVAEKADPKLYGLDRPQLQWKLRFADQDVLTLQVGNPEPGNAKHPRLHAKLANKDVVFLLDPLLSAKVQEEFRKRKPWESFDPAQAERISFKGPKESFTLLKIGKEWSAPTMPEAKVNSQVVTDTLDTLARLEVLRYVVDHKADLQLYGLVPPTLTIEVDVPGGKRTLQLGRPEGTSQRLYASVPGSDAVFLLAETDAQKLQRPPAAYAK